LVRDPNAHDPDLADVRLVLAGDEHAFERIVLRNEARLRRQLRGLLRDRDLVEDVLQEVWAAAWCHLRSFAGRARLHRWLRTIAAREAARARAGRGPGPRAWLPLAADEDHEPVSDLPCPAVVSGQRDELRALVDRLPKRGRRAFLLTAAGWSYAEVAEHLGSPIGSVGTWVHRARCVMDEAGAGDTALVS